jgi:hypothetical protein
MKTWIRFAAVALALLALLAVPATVHAQAWTAAASTGAVDESSLGFFAFTNSSLGYLPGSMSLQRVVGRYNVTDVTASGTPPWTTLELTYFDNAAGSQVTAQLFQVTPCTGAIALLCTAVSVNAPANACVTCTLPAGAVLNFNNFVYYVEVVISRNNAALTPSAIALRIF